MAARPGTTLALAGFMAAALLAPMSVRAIEVKKSLYSGAGAATAAGPATVNPISPAQKKQLEQVVADASDSYVSDESEKKSSGQPYIDLGNAKFTYVPRMMAGKWNVEARLEAPEYLPPKNGEGLGKPTGKRKALVFRYRLDGAKWVQTEPPKWQEVSAATAIK